jgi:hypothetical protein
MPLPVQDMTQAHNFVMSVRDAIQSKKKKGGLMDLKNPLYICLAVVLLPLLATRASADCNLQDSTVHVRSNIYELAKTPSGQKTIDSLRKGVAAMMNRSETDPTSWLSQANIHGIAPGDNTPPLPLWSNCQHGTYFFFSWHRMYLYFFERILRKASGDPNFALPYWNYSAPVQSALPEPFRLPADSSISDKSMGHSNRSRTITSMCGSAAEARPERRPRV